MPVETPGFDEIWRWTGWTAANEGASEGSVDLDGNLILVGSQGLTQEYGDDDTFADTFTGDFAAVKLSGDSGEVIWIWTDSSLANQVDLLFSVDTDSNNDVITGGSTEGYWTTRNPEGTRHLAVAKLDGRTGGQIWAYQESATSSSFWGAVDYGILTAIGLAIDGDDNVVFVGQTSHSFVAGEGGPYDSDYFALKLNGKDGSEMWRMQGGLTHEWDMLMGVNVDPAGDLVAVGETGDKDKLDFLVLKMSGATGSILWEYSPLPSSTSNVLHAVDFDADGHVFVAGGAGVQNLQGTIAERPVVLKIHGETGALIWSYFGVAESKALFQSVAVDPLTGWVLGAGTTEGTWLPGAAQGNHDFAAVVLDSKSGDEIYRYQSGTPGSDEVWFAGFDSVGGLFLGGLTEDLSGETDFAAIKFAPWNRTRSASLSAGAIAAIVSGVAILLLLCAVCICYRKRKQHQIKESVVPIAAVVGANGTAKGAMVTVQGTPKPPQGDTSETVGHPTPRPLQEYQLSDGVTGEMEPPPPYKTSPHRNQQHQRNQRGND